MPVYSDIEKIENPLHKLLLIAVPENKHGNKTLNHLADLLGVTKWSIRKWINNNRISGQRVAQVVALSEDRVQTSDFDAYVYKA